MTLVLSNKQDRPTKFDIDETVLIQCQCTYDILIGRIVMPPKSQIKTYTVRLNDNGREIELKAIHIYTEHNILETEM